MFEPNALFSESHTHRFWPAHVASTHFLSSCTLNFLGGCNYKGWTLFGPSTQPVRLRGDSKKRSTRRSTKRARTTCEEAADEAEMAAEAARLASAEAAAARTAVEAQMALYAMAPMDRRSASLRKCGCHLGFPLHPEKVAIRIKHTHTWTCESLESLLELLEGSIASEPSGRGPNDS